MPIVNRVKRAAIAAVAMSLLVALPVFAQIEEAPPRVEGDGLHERLVIRGAILIDGTGGPPRGLVDAVVEGHEITQIQNVGSPGLLIEDDARPDAGTREISAAGMYLLPEFVGLHAHIGGTAQGTLQNMSLNCGWATVLQPFVTTPAAMVLNGN